MPDSEFCKRLTLLKYRARRIGPANGSASPSPGFVPTGAGRGGFRPFGRCRFPQRRYAAGGQQDSDKEEQGPEGHQQDSQSGSCARPCAGGTPALPGSRHLMTSLFPVRGNRQDQGEARRRAGGGGNTPPRNSPLVGLRHSPAKPSPHRSGSTRPCARPPERLSQRSDCPLGSSIVRGACR